MRGQVGGERESGLGNGAWGVCSSYGGGDGRRIGWSGGSVHMTLRCDGRAVDDEGMLTVDGRWSMVMDWCDIETKSETRRYGWRMPTNSARLNG